MDQDNFSTVPPDIKSLGGKAWTAYVGTVLMAFFLLFIVVPLAWSASWGAGVFLLAASIPFIAYRILVLRSYSLYHNDAGVWVYSGILPWKKGVMGVK